ncbi:hypothetical protein [Nocardia shimofusensis]|uniref:hypothetical protein n=1 Tax=Nocardia shimofusensis TaxID=228596 RepID=UPI0008308E12|nr:hypothetical protein [Nocardia shimofusensis]
MLPELPAIPVSTEGTLRRLPGRTVVVLDFAAPRGPHRGRRYRVEHHHGPGGCSRVVFNIDGRAALRPPPWAAQQTSGAVKLRLRPLPDRRHHRIPPDLQQALAAADLDLDHITEPELAQILEMIVESGNEQVRADRIAVAVHSIAQAGTHRKARE